MTARFPKRGVASPNTWAVRRAAALLAITGASASVRACVLVGLLAAGCAPRPSAPPVATGDVEHTEWSSAFEAVGAVGTFVLRDLETGRTQRYNPDRAAERMLPASTFKVYNALVALETGVVSDPDSMFVWDGVERFLPAWNQDQSLRDGLQNSTVWVYQRVARRVGRDRYRQSFGREPYGDSQIGPDVGLFWLDQSLRVSADEQARFIERLHKGELAFRPEAQRTVREMMPVLIDTLGTRVVGKTGWGERAGQPDLGWIVGWVEGPGGTAAFALNAEAAGPDSGFSFADRLRIVRAILRADGRLAGGAAGRP